jgi:hypothetical protein
MHPDIQAELFEDPTAGDSSVEWIRKATLVSLILDAVQTVEWPEFDFELTASSGFAFRRLGLLSLVTYCYAIGVHGSENIAARASEDDVLNLLCGGLLPTCEEIRDFRRSHRQLVERSLTETLRLARAFGLRRLPVLGAEHPRGQSVWTGTPAESDFERLTGTTETRVRPTPGLDAMALDD